MYINHRHYILLVFALGAFAAAIFGYSFLRAEILSQATTSATILKQVNEMSEKQKREQDVASIYSKSAEERAKLMSLIVSREKIVNFIELVEKIGTDTGSVLELSGITNEDERNENPDALTHFKSHVDVRGAWPNVMRALVLIENMPYNISLDNIHITEGGEASAEGLQAQPTGSSTRPLARPAKTWKLSLDLRFLTGK